MKQKRQFIFTMVYHEAKNIVTYILYNFRGESWVKKFGRRFCVRTPEHEAAWNLFEGSQKLFAGRNIIFTAALQPIINLIIMIQ